MKTQLLKCDGCTVCCQKDAIYLNNEDNKTLYLTEIYNDKIILAHKDNGDCIYLDRDKGCMIYEHRPIVCRGFDCRHLLKKAKLFPNLVRAGVISPETLEAAKRAKKRNRYQ